MPGMTRFKTRPSVCPYIDCPSELAGHQARQMRILEKDLEARFINADVLGLNDECSPYHRRDLEHLGLVARHLRQKGGAQCVALKPVSEPNIWAIN